MTNTNALHERWGARIRQLRESRGLSVKRLAWLADLDQGHLCRAEQGQAGLSDGPRMRVAAALGVEVAEIFAYPSVEES